jgi:hypothetical protein
MVMVQYLLDCILITSVASSRLKENATVRKLATQAMSTRKAANPSDGPSDGPLTEGTNGTRERSQRKKKPTTKVEMYCK